MGDVRQSTELPYSSASPSITRVKPCHLLVASVSPEHLRNAGQKRSFITQAAQNSVKLLPVPVPFSNSHIGLVLFIHHFASTIKPSQNSFGGFGRPCNFITIMDMVKCCHQLEKTPDSRESLHRWTSPGTTPKLLLQLTQPLALPTCPVPFY